MSDSQGAFIAHAAISSCLTIAVGAVAVASFLQAQRYNDPARDWVPIMRLVLILTFGRFTLAIASDALNISNTGLTDMANNPSTPAVAGNADFNAMNVMHLGTLLQRVAGILTMILFMELGHGFMYALDKKTKTWQRVMRICTLANALPLLGLALAQFSLSVDSRQSYYSSVASLHRTKLSFAVCQLSVALGTVAYAAVVEMTHRNQPLSGTSPFLYLLATVLNVPRWAYLSIFYGLGVPGEPHAISVSGNLACEAAFDFILFFVSLVLVVIIARRHTSGVWSIPHLGGRTDSGLPLLADQWSTEYNPTTTHKQRDFPQMSVKFREPLSKQYTITRMSTGSEELHSLEADLEGDSLVDADIVAACYELNIWSDHVQASPREYV